MTKQSKKSEVKIQFIKELNEKSIPSVRLTRSRDGSTGTAKFRFINANILSKDKSKRGEITGMYLIDEEGVLKTKDINAIFINGKPIGVESLLIIKGNNSWNRFMRFMRRYSTKNKLKFY